MESMQAEVVIVGAGAVGLSIGLACARQGLQTIVLERHGRPGEELSSRNSEVIHAGLYYPPGSLKARMCVRGRHLLGTFLRTWQVPHQWLGKYVVARDERGESTLTRLLENARENGVEGLALLNRAAIRSACPMLNASAALWSPVTGILDSAAFIRALGQALAEADGVLACVHRVEAMDAGSRVLKVRGPDQRVFEVRAERIVLANGLGLPALLSATTGLARDYGVTYAWAKGHYFSYQGAVPFRHLIYPLPAEGGLGIHLTLDLSGAARFGPDVDWVDRPDWQADPARKPAFVEAIRSWWPEVDPRRLQPAWAGVRPKLERSSAFMDFRIDDQRAHGVPGLWILAGIESPGLTAALALGEHVAASLSSA